MTDGWLYILAEDRVNWIQSSDSASLKHGLR